MDRHQHRAEPHVRADEIPVQTKPLHAVVAEHAAGRNVDFLKVDVEGFEEIVLASVDWSAFRPVVICVEAVEPMTARPTHRLWDPILREAHYTFALFDGV